MSSPPGPVRAVQTLIADGSVFGEQVTGPFNLVGPNPYIPWNIKQCYVYTDAKTYGIRSGSKLVSTISAEADTIVLVRDKTDEFGNLWSNSGRMKIEGEIIGYTARSYDNFKITFTGCTRGLDGGTAAQPHTKGKLASYFANPEDMIRHAVPHEADLLPEN